VPPDRATTRFLERMAAASGKPLQDCTPEEARRFGAKLAELNGSGPAMRCIDEHTVARKDGTCRVRDLVPKMLTHAGTQWFWDHYVHDLSQRGDWHAAPLRAADHSGLPAAVVMTAEFDVRAISGEVVPILIGVGLPDLAN
jgi:alpha/beta hydrolase fold